MTDPLLKLRDVAAQDPGKLTELLRETATAPISPEARATFEKRPEFSRDFLERQSQQFGVSIEKIQEIADSVMAQGPPTFVVHAREFGVDTEARAHFRNLYDTEILKRRKCGRWIVEADDRTKKKIKRACGELFTDVMQAMVHHSIHILFESDYRTQRAHWNDIRELLSPTQERGIQAALPQSEREKIADDLRRRGHLLSR